MGVVSRKNIKSLLCATNNSLYFMQKKVKISAVKRSAHLKSKKTPLTKQQQQKLNQQKASKEKKQNIFSMKAHKKDNLAQRKKLNKQQSLGLPLQNGNASDEDEEQLVDNIADMLDGDDLEYLQTKGGGRQRKRKNESTTDEKDAVGLELAYTSDSVKEKATQKVKINLLPIKSRDGEIITRTTEVDYKPRPKAVKLEAVESDAEADDDSASIYEDSDDDIVNDEEAAVHMHAEPEKKLISTTDLLIARQQEIERQKYRIGIICSGILEKPEDKMRNFNALFELMDESNAAGTPNLLTVRKVAIISVTEIFKDILPEYRVGQVDTKMQTGKNWWLVKFLLIACVKIFFLSSQYARLHSSVLHTKMCYFNNLKSFYKNWKNLQLT